MSVVPWVRTRPVVVVDVSATAAPNTVALEDKNCKIEGEDTVW